MDVQQGTGAAEQSIQQVPPNELRGLCRADAPIGDGVLGRGNLSWDLLTDTGHEQSALSIILPGVLPLLCGAVEG